MCFYVSWKLSILAITSIFPIIQITRIYSKSAHPLQTSISRRDDVYSDLVIHSSAVVLLPHFVCAGSVYVCVCVGDSGSRGRSTNSQPLGEPSLALCRAVSLTHTHPRSHHWLAALCLCAVRVWAALAESSNLATQAITNIRTVRAFGTEDHEDELYREATTEALSKSILDAKASSLSYTLTSYLDLGTTVLLLWYGGMVVMDADGNKDDPLSVGKLITFQLSHPTHTHTHIRCNTTSTAPSECASSARCHTVRPSRSSVSPPPGLLCSIVRVRVAATGT